MRKFVFGLALIAAVNAANTAAAGDCCKLVGRFLGLGWSDGYHSQLNCCPGGCDGDSGFAGKNFGTAYQRGYTQKSSKLPTYPPRPVFVAPTKGK